MHLENETPSPNSSTFKTLIPVRQRGKADGAPWAPCCFGKTGRDPAPKLLPGLRSEVTGSQACRLAGAPSPPCCGLLPDHTAPTPSGCSESLVACLYFHERSCHEIGASPECLSPSHVLHWPLSFCESVTGHPATAPQRRL